VTAAGSALLFPGQGSQAPGMGGALVASGRQSALLQLAEESGVPLRRLLVTGTAEELRPTEVAQPALFYTGIALAEMLIEGGLRPLAAAGHSLGEYCAVVAAGSLSAEDAMGLVLERGRLMASAPAGTMAAVLGLDLAALEELCRQVAEAGECCVVANDNAPGQVVISGTGSGVEQVGQLAKEAGARRVVPLNVGGAFHSPLMGAAAEAFARQLDQIAFEEPKFPIAAGVTGAISTTATAVRTGLRDQLAGPVRWVSVINALAAAGAASFVECGPGGVLGGLNRRIVPTSWTFSVDSPDTCAKFLAEDGSGSPREVG
jgi:[acyl-carrier-protein] S-malonyltransferase